LAGPVRRFAHQGAQFRIYDSAEDMGAGAAQAIVDRQIELAQTNDTVTIQVMAAPSAYAFYNAYVARAKTDAALQEVLTRTHFFQFDDYDLPRDHPASFCYLLEKHLFSHLAAWCPDKQIHYFCVHGRDPQEVCAAYTRDLLALGPDLQVKGMGENGHWGFHEPGIPLEGEPSFVEVALTPENARQQMRDHPDLFPDLDSVPKSAYTANVPLFLKTRDAIEDCVPQASKAFALLAAYGTDRIDKCLPSSAAKQHDHLTVHTTTAAAWALERFLENGAVHADDLRKMAESLTSTDASVDEVASALGATLEQLAFPLN
jgi:glucosamine-6-phosphate deaminase